MLYNLFIEEFFWIFRVTALEIIKEFKFVPQPLPLRTWQVSLCESNCRLTRRNKVTRRRPTTFGSCATTIAKSMDVETTTESGEITATSVKPEFAEWKRASSRTTAESATTTTRHWTTSVLLAAPMNPQCPLFHQINDTVWFVNFNFDISCSKNDRRIKWFPIAVKRIWTKSYLYLLESNAEGISFENK